MTLGFSDANPVLAARLNSRQARAAAALAANDNPVLAASDPTLHAALRHFAVHGLAAASLAREQAEAALLAGEPGAYQWWLDICRMLDRRMAAAVAARATS